MRIVCVFIIYKDAVQSLSKKKMKLTQSKLQSTFTHDVESMQQRDFHKSIYIYQDEATTDKKKSKNKMPGTRAKRYERNHNNSYAL